MANCLTCKYFIECEQAIAYIDDDKVCYFNEEAENVNSLIKKISQCSNCIYRDSCYDLLIYGAVEHWGGICKRYKQEENENENN